MLAKRAHPENRLWMESKAVFAVFAVFAAVHAVGSNNGYEP